MADGNSITRSEVEAMINAALANVRGQAGARGGEYQSGLKKPPSFQGPTRYGESQAVVSGLAMGQRVARQEANEAKARAREKAAQEPVKIPAEVTPTPAPKPTIAEKRSVMGGGERQTTIGTNDVRGLSRETGGRSKEAIADQIKATQEKFKEKTKADQKTAGQDASPEVMQAVVKTAEGMAKTFVTEEQVKAMLDGIHPAILNQCRAAVQQNQGGTGNSYLILPASAVTTNISAVWGKGGAGEGGLTDDYCFVGQQKVTIPQTGKTGFLKITLGASPSATWVEAMVETQATDSVVFEVAKNRIYLSGEFGG